MGDKVGAVAVIGGGISGMQSALDLADSGYLVYIIDSSPSIGGAMAQLDKTFPTNDCAMCIMAPKLVETGRHNNIKLITNADVHSVEGGPGNFKLKIDKKPRYVDESKCTGCGLCTQRCPVEVKDDYNRGFKVRKAIYIKYPQAVPPTHCIDQEYCIGCGICETQCRAGAIQYSQTAVEEELDVGSIIVSPGFEEFNLSVMRREYGYSKFPNVVSSLELERMLSATGPYGGVVLRPSDGKVAQKVAFIQCVGSRDRTIGNPYCSSVCCMFAIKEAVIAQEHTPGLSSTIFFMDMRAFGKEFDDYFIRAAQEHNVRFVSNNRISSIEENAETKNLSIVYIEGGELKREEFDLVVLAVGMEHPKGAHELGEKLGIELNDFDFAATTIFSPISTNKEGIYVCGVFQDPKDIPDSVSQASGAAARASSIISSERDTLTTVKVYPPERDVTAEEPRIGAFICHCGINIGGVVDVPAVVNYAKTLPDVAYAEDNLYTCSQDTQDHIKEMIKEHNLNRIMVASCTPRTHQPLFQNTVAEGGLNPYLFEMSNIRDQCSWVHMNEPEKATEKAKGLVRMAVAKSRLNAALPKIPESVNSNDRIKVYTSTNVKEVSGYVGNFETVMDQNGEDVTIEHGAIIVATGGVEYKPKEFLYGENDRVLTQLEFDNKLFSNALDPDTKTIVMIQCVGCRNQERTYCSRVCCTEAVKNALKAKDVNPNVSVVMLYRDMRTYGFREIYYEEAARQGVTFLRFDEETEPIVTDEDGLTVKVYDHFLNEDVVLKPDYLVLSTATIPNPDNQELAHILKVPLSKDGFFLEAHMKLRPVEFATDGIYLCGLAHSPKFFNECLSQASAAVSRAATILSKDKIYVEGMISSVNEDKCTGCGTCEMVCPYGAITVDLEESKAKVAEVLCKGCGTCGAACPEKAIDIAHFTDMQLIAQAIASLKEGSA
jgi:heterodisulfide reductase subunit A